MTKFSSYLTTAVILSGIFTGIFTGCKSTKLSGAASNSFLKYQAEIGRLESEYEYLRERIDYINRIVEEPSIESLRLNLGKKYKVDPFVEENGKKEFNVYRDYDYKFNFQVRDIIEMLGKNLSKYQIIFDKNEEWICIREA